MSREQPHSPLKRILEKRRSCLDDNDLSEGEREFLRLVEDGDLTEMRKLLETSGCVINIDCCDCKGYRALDIAVTLRDEDLVRNLMSLCTFSKEHVKGALLRAVDINDIELTKILLERCEATESKEESSKQECLELSPLMSAAINGNFEMVRFFLHKGFRIVKPHLPSCSCFQCSSGVFNPYESLQDSLARIRAYRALASPIYIVLASKDPILTAFKLSHETAYLANEFSEHQDIYQNLSAQCSQFAADFLHQCCNTDEVETLLMQKKGLNDIRNHRYNRICLAMQYKQKRFISHPTCQQVLHSKWVEGLCSWKKLTTQRKALHIFVQCIMTPVVCIMHVLLPRAEVIKPMRVPLNRFIYSLTSYFVFLILLLLSLFWESRQDIRKPAVWPRLVADFWVLGYIIEVIIKIWSMGISQYLRIWWNRYDLIMHMSFMLSELISISVYIYSYVNANNIKWNRMELSWYHPLLIGEGIFACASVLAFCKVLFWYQVHSKLGPLGISLTYMMTDVLRFFMIFFILMFSFAIGINSIYRNYKDSVRVQNNGEVKVQPGAFISLRETFKTLFWTPFGMGEADYADVIVSGNFTNSSYVNHIFTEDVGYVLWGFYHLLTVIIMLNMLIAMMTESYERVQGNSDMEWKFARCTLWMSYFDNESTVPSPFNLLPSLRRLASIVRWIFAKLSKNVAVSHHISAVRDAYITAKCCNCEDAVSNNSKDYEEKYEQLLTRLRRKYLDWRKQKKMSANPPSYVELSEKIKQDVLHCVRKKYSKNWKYCETQIAPEYQ